MGQGPRFSPLWLKSLRPTDSKPSPSTMPSRCLIECPERPGSTARMPGFMPWPPRSVCGAVQHPSRRRAVRHSGLAGQKLGRGTTLGCAGRACTRARGLAHGTWRVHPVAGDELDTANTTRRCARCYHLQEHARDNARLSYTGVLRGDGELGAKVAQELKRVAAATRAARLAGGQA
jgi:hypothetical protein